MLCTVWICKCYTPETAYEQITFYTSEKLSQFGLEMQI